MEWVNQSFIQEFYRMVIGNALGKGILSKEKHIREIRAQWQLAKYSLSSLIYHI